MANTLYGGTKTEMERLIADANAWGAANGGASDLSIDSFSDVVTAIQQIQEAQRIAGTSAEEAGATISGSMDSAKAAWDDLLTEFGKDDGNIDKAADNFVTALIGDGTDENKGVLGNVGPRIEEIVTNVVEQLPGIIERVAPQVSEAILSMLDSMTGGMSTKVLDTLAPVSDAIGTAFSGIGEWYTENKDSIDQLAETIGTFAGTVSEVLGGAIEFVAPLIGDLASGGIPLLNGAINLANGLLKGYANMFENLAKAISPVTDALAPVVEAIGTALADALFTAGDAFATADFSEFAENVSGGLQTVIDFIGQTVEALGGFFDGVAEFIEDPVGTIERGFSSLMSGGEETQKSVSGSFNAMDKNVDRSLDGVNRSIRATNRTDLKDKKASAEVEGNGVDGKGKKGVEDTSKAINSMKGNTVRAEVKGNAKDKTVADRIWGTVDAIKGLFSKSVTVTTKYDTKGAPSGGTRVASGGIRYHANGFIANNYGGGVPLDIVGEDGAEAIIPLTNKRYTRPFAETVAESMLSKLSGAGGVTVNLTYNGSGDATELVNRLTRDLRMMRMTGAI